MSMVPNADLDTSITSQPVFRRLFVWVRLDNYLWSITEPKPPKHNKWVVQGRLLILNHIGDHV